MFAIGEMLFLQVHVVKDTTRGATLEVVVSRMKAVHAYRTAQNPDAGLSMRFVAVSATIPNVSDVSSGRELQYVKTRSDTAKKQPRTKFSFVSGCCQIADWLSDENGPATYLNMDESHRPVKLRKVVLGFPCNPNQTDFKFDLSLNYKMANIIQIYSDQKPALVVSVLIAQIAYFCVYLVKMFSTFLQRKFDFELFIMFCLLVLLHKKRSPAICCRYGQRRSLHHGH